MENIQPISYRPLDDDEIRLVAVQPGMKTDTIKCEMVYSSFNTAQEQKYEALSYTWGSPDDLRTMLLDGATCEVRENLWWALYHLRKEEEVRRLWIDALSINQADILERNQQVGQMDRIYKEANVVAVWLGRESEDDANALQYFWDIRSKGDLPRHFDRCIADSEENNKWFAQHLPKWQHILHLCARKYWTRLWVIQEFCLANQAWVHYGDLRMDWRNLRDVIYCVACLEYEGEGADIKNVIATSHLTRIFQGKILMGGVTESKSMLELVLHHRESACFETRDKIFGLHSLSQACCRTAVPVDYSKSLPELSIGLLEHHLIQHGTEDFIPGSRVVQDLFLQDQSQADEEHTARLTAETGSRVPRLFKVRAWYCSVLSYTSPSLDSLSEEFYDGISNGTECIFLSRALFYSITDVNDYLDSQGLYKTAEYPSHHLDNIQVADWLVSLEVPSSMSKMKLGAVDVPLTQEDHREALSNEEQMTARVALVRIFRFAEEMTRRSCRVANCKLLLMPTGEIRLGPSTIAKGDWCCTLDKFGPDIIVRVKEDGNGLETVGRAVGFLADKLQRKTVNFPELSIHIGFETLMELTTPEGKSRYT